MRTDAGECLKLLRRDVQPADIVGFEFLGLVVVEAGEKIATTPTSLEIWRSLILSILLGGRNNFDVEMQRYEVALSCRGGSCE